LRDIDVEIGALDLDCGETLSAVVQRVTLDGVEPLPDGSNVVFAAHALTGSSRVAEWWPGIAGGSEALFDRATWCIVGVNALGSCYGSSFVWNDARHPERSGQSERYRGTGACHPERSERSERSRGTGSCHPQVRAQRASKEFPRITVRDMLRAQQRALYHLSIAKIGVVIGGSLGGMQTLQWALDAPDRITRAIIIGAHDHHSAMGIALNAVQREAIALDTVRGVALARKIAMLTYKSEELLNERHDRRLDRNDPTRFDVEGYLDHQGAKFVNRMDGASYAALTHAMDSFDVRDRAAPRGVDLTFVGISSDRLFRPQDVRAAADRLGARYVELTSTHGHDAFLADVSPLTRLLGVLS